MGFSMTIDELKEKASNLPLTPGVYIMRDKNDVVIYVGKAKKLRNRVSQYFQDMSSHSTKTRMMVSRIHHFEVIVAASEFEALVLECAQIKRYQPKYNILLKDDKGYPFIRIDSKSLYPKMTLSNRTSNDGSLYFGPFGSRGVTADIIESITKIFRLPSCNKVFPRDIGKDRVCLHYHMGQCDGWCQKDTQQSEYSTRMMQVQQLLSGNYQKVYNNIQKQMLSAADSMQFEIAANLRDRLNAIENLGKKQLVSAKSFADTDVIGFAQTESKACFTVLHYQCGQLLDKDYEIYSYQESPRTSLSSLVHQYYLTRGFAPRVILLPFDLDDMDIYSQILQKMYGRAVQIKVPQRGVNVRLIDLACRNALEEAERITTKEEKHFAVQVHLGKMLSIGTPRRIESFDISNISGTDIVGSMVVFQDGKPKKSDYKRFKIQDLSNQDDYASMEQIIKRRFLHYINRDSGFDEMPDLLLVDGGCNHASIALTTLESLDITIPVFGMVKDNRHRTRALVSAQGHEVAIDTNQSIFSFIGTIQEETHRFAITYHRQLRSNRLKQSELDMIEGIGPSRKEKLLRAFHSVKGISKASLSELEKHLPKNVAKAVYMHFNKDNL